jgi:DNA-binding SARP family transcriptional activator
MPQRDPRQTIVKLRHLLDELDADLATGRDSVAVTDSANLADDEKRYVAERAGVQLARYRGKSSAPTRRRSARP